MFATKTNATGSNATKNPNHVKKERAESLRMRPGGLHPPLVRGQTTHGPRSLSFHRSQTRVSRAPGSRFSLKRFSSAARAPNAWRRPSAASQNLLYLSLPLCCLQHPRTLARSHPPPPAAGSGSPAPPRPGIRLRGRNSRRRHRRLRTCPGARPRAAAPRIRAPSRAAPGPVPTPAAPAPSPCSLRSMSPSRRQPVPARPARPPRRAPPVLRPLLPGSPLPRRRRAHWRRPRAVGSAFPGRHPTT